MSGVVDTEAEISEVLGYINNDFTLGKIKGLFVVAIYEDGSAVGQAAGEFIPDILMQALSEGANNIIGQIIEQMEAKEKGN